MDPKLENRNQVSELYCCVIWPCIVTYCEPITVQTSKNKDTLIIRYILFLAFDLLRIDVYAFKSFCKDFFSKYPGYYLRISGSAVESLFSQYKYAAGGKPNAANYASSRGANLIKQTISTHHSGKGHRDGHLSTATLPLKKKQYNKKSRVDNS